ncbi:Na+/H+ antiporter NhaA [Oricola indica]|uniref:Na+/H+ antiporter NhaA n=1 Tax=Oricola indica TaxID=2872591 RepID=UPI001CBF342D|nr:Na+/H+ antiporter NhaA [Oricola indica]
MTDHVTQSVRDGRRAGLAMLVGLALGLVAANSPLADTYALIHHLPLRVGPVAWAIEAPLIEWINQGLLTVFFFLIGIHTNHELTRGTLSEPGAAVLPASAAVGGMIVPAAIYLGLNAGETIALRGWAIPIATDIVLVLGVLSLCSGQVGPAIVAFATAAAIFDDLGSVAVIALFYGELDQLLPLWIVAGGSAGLLLLNRTRKASLVPYLFFGCVLWAGLIMTGLEGAVAGAIVGFSLPLSSFPSKAAARAEQRISPFALFFVVPVFTFFNGGIVLDFVPADPQAWSVAIGIAIALIVGKPLGILGGTLLALRLRIGTLPPDTSLRDLFGVALLAGVGFTMSLFIVGAAFDAAPIAATAKLAVVSSSAIAALLGILSFNLRRSVGR